MAKQNREIGALCLYLKFTNAKQASYTERIEWVNYLSDVWLKLYTDCQLHTKTQLCCLLHAHFQLHAGC